MVLRSRRGRGYLGVFESLCRFWSWSIYCVVVLLSGRGYLGGFWVPMPLLVLVPGSFFIGPSRVGEST